MKNEERSAKVAYAKAELEKALAECDPNDKVSLAICQVMLMTAYLQDGLHALFEGLEIIEARVKRLEGGEQ